MRSKGGITSKITKNTMQMRRRAALSNFAHSATQQKVGMKGKKIGRKIK